MQVNIPLTLEQVDQVLNTLIERPYKEVVNLIQVIRFNAEKQIVEANATAQAAEAAKQDAAEEARAA